MTTHAVPPIHDPLRAVRLAVTAGRFYEAVEQLQGLPPDASGSADGLLLRAMAVWRLGEYPRSRETAHRARDAFRARADSDGEMRAENVGAAGAFALGDLSSAERGFVRALTLADKLGEDLMVARCANNLGNVAYYRSNLSTALGFYRLAIAGFEKLTWWKGLAEGWLNSAIVSREARDLDRSRDAADHAVDFAERAGDSRVFGQALATRAETHARLGDLELAGTEARHAELIAAAESNPVDQADALRIRALVHRLRHEQDDATKRVESSVGMAARLEHPWTLAEAQREAGDVYLASGRKEQAATSFRMSAAAFDRVGAGRRSREMLERVAELTAT